MKQKLYFIYKKRARRYMNIHHIYYTTIKHKNDNKKLKETF